KPAGSARVQRFVRPRPRDNNSLLPHTAHCADADPRLACVSLRNREPSTLRPQIPLLILARLLRRGGVRGCPNRSPTPLLGPQRFAVAGEQIDVADQE